MKIWKSFAASTIGPQHLISGTYNQDFKLTFHKRWGDGVVVSDGLGSKEFSNFGSEGACYAVLFAAQIASRKKFEHLEFLELIREKWLSNIAPLEPTDCLATCLFAVRLNDGLIRLGMLGDGLIAVQRTDGKVIIPFQKEDLGFTNFTASLSANTRAEDWQYTTIPERKIRAVILCTDGISEDLEEPYNFVGEFVEFSLSHSTASAANYALQMLEDWPVPKHSDDKTIACLFQKEISDE